MNILKDMLVVYADGKLLSLANTAANQGGVSIRKDVIWTTGIIHGIAQEG